jgi:uroporphyrinogen-III decarboxylase
LTHRERWLATLRFEPVDHVPDEEFGYWSDTFVRWHEEGLPAEVDDNLIADRYFRFAPRMQVPVNIGLLPAFETQVVEETEKYRIVSDGDGNLLQQFTDGTSTIPRYLRFAIESRADWEKFRERLDPDDPARYPADWDARIAELNASEMPVEVHLGSLLGTFRNWIGFENIAIMCMDQPDLIQDMMEYWVYFITTLLKRAVEQVRIDAGAFWEDICFNKGCMISPKMFRDWMTPRYRRITDFVRQAGAEIFYVDCDGNIMDVVECWLDGGVNTMFPVEVAGGSDPFEMRRRWGSRVMMLGGVNKRALARGPVAIDEELARLAPLVQQGGMIPHVDHRVPPDVSFDDYLYYLKRKRELLGIPQPEHGL